MGTTKIKIMQDKGIYGSIERDGYLPDGAEALCVFKGDKLWSIMHMESGLSVDSLIPVRMKRTKALLVDFVQRMAKDKPDAFWALGAVKSPSGWNNEQREAARVLHDWAREQEA